MDHPQVWYSKTSCRGSNIEMEVQCSMEYQSGTRGRCCATSRVPVSVYLQMLFSNAGRSSMVVNLCALTQPHLGNSTHSTAFDQPWSRSEYQDQEKKLQGDVKLLWVMMPHLIATWKKFCVISELSSMRTPHNKLKDGPRTITSWSVELTAM